MAIFYKVDLKVKGIENSEHEDIHYKKNHALINATLKDLFINNELPVLFLIANYAEDMVVYAAYDLLSSIEHEIDLVCELEKAFELVNCKLSFQNVSVSEISAFLYMKSVERSDIETHRLREAFDKRLHIEYTRNYATPTGYSVRDYIVSDKIKTVADAKKELTRILSEDRFDQEIDRIFSPEHPKNFFYGIPVHYKIAVSSEAVADDMIEVLVSSLFCNKRILSQRVTKIDQIKERSSDIHMLEDIFLASVGSTVAITLNGDVANEEQYASNYHYISDVLAKHIKRLSGEVLIIFIEITSHPGFAKQLLGKVDEDLDIIEIQEGIGNKDEATKYFMRLLKESNLHAFYEVQDNRFEESKAYTATEVRSEFNKWRKLRLKDRIYKAYNNNLITLKIEKRNNSGAAKNELETMIGLEEVKQIIDEIIAFYRVERMRKQFYESKVGVSQHMIFSGNPGTAKTTVARLMTEIMKENGLLRTGVFVECGRADLVGKYVGWTAQIVKEKFREAEGGVLFIDEAYSLVDESNTFGAEAINTIVAEMENRRDSVIVIFAGYPDKMEVLLNQNEGLRSRIKWHVKFPDYTPEELMKIMQKIAKDRKYIISEAAEKNLMIVFESIYKQKEYGNGRFVRNLFEQAINKQAVRLLQKENVNKKQLFTLEDKDFDTNIVSLYKSKVEKKIGFT